MPRSNQSSTPAQSTPSANGAYRQRWGLHGAGTSSRLAAGWAYQVPSTTAPSPTT